MKTLDDIPGVERMRRNIRKLWPRRSKKFDGFERVSLHTHIPDYGDKTPIHYAVLDPVGEYCIHRRDFAQPGMAPTWYDQKVRFLARRLPYQAGWSRSTVKVWQGERPSCIKPFEF